MKLHYAAMAGPHAVSAAWLRWGALLLFVLLCSGFIINFAVGDFPDEVAHLGYVTDVVGRGFPDYASGTMFGSGKFNYLPHPALYYIFAGWAYHLLPDFPGSVVTGVRSINLLVSLVTLQCYLLGARAAGMSAAAALFGLLFIVSVPMFVVLSASVNNDPLSILGCAMTTVGLILLQQHVPSRLAWPIAVCGGLIAILSKGTGALTVACLGAAWLLVPRCKVISSGTRVRRADWIWMIIAVLVVMAYYGYVLHRYGRLFPAPQGDPSGWFRTEHPQAPRWSLWVHLQQFFAVNVASFSTPYGHVPIPDLPWRANAVKLLLASYPAFAALALLRERALMTPRYRLVVTFLLAQVTFICLYFIAVRLLHMATGYPGAIQARYLFGFLPSMAVVYGIGYSHLGVAWLRRLVLVFAAACVGALLYDAYSTFSLRPTIEQTRGQSNFGELTGDRSFAQKVMLPSSARVRKIELKFATFARINSAPLVLTVLADDGAKLASVAVSAATAGDNAWCAFRFDHLKLDGGRRYTLRLTSPEARPGNAITWWAAAAVPDRPPFLGTPFGPPEPDQYIVKEGAVVDGQPTAAAFTYRISMDYRWP
jgi:hypothetical protein